MINKLKEGIAFVRIEFSDGSARTIRTSINTKILSENGARYRKNYLYDLDKKQYYKIKEDASNIEIMLEKPYPRNEVEEFVNRFIWWL